jgi:hypothetical protein
MDELDLAIFYLPEAKAAAVGLIKEHFTAFQIYRMWREEVNRAFGPEIAGKYQLILHGLRGSYNAIVILDEIPY